MNLRRLRYFVVVAEELHFGRAAQRLHIAQPALTQNVQALEAEFNVELLTRSSRRVELTEAGAVLFAEAQRLLELADQVHHRMHAFVLGHEGTLRLNFARSAAGGASSAIVEMLRNEAPALQLQINSQYTAKSIEDLLDGKLDAAFVRSPLEMADPAVGQLQVLPIGSEALVVALPRSHRLTRRQRIHAADLVDEPIVTGSAQRAPGFYRLMFGQIWGDRSPRIVLHEPDEEHMLRAVAAGTGLTILTESRAKAIQVQGVAIRRFAAPEPRAGLALVWSASNLSTALAVLIDVAQRFVSQHVDDATTGPGTPSQPAWDRAPSTSDRSSS